MVRRVCDAGLVVQGGDFRSQEELLAPEWGEGGIKFSLETLTLWVREEGRVRVHWGGEAGGRQRGETGRGG